MVTSKLLLSQKALLNHINKLDYINETKELDQVEIVTVAAFHFYYWPIK